MAIYHLTAKTVSRGESVSSAARSDYIERAGRYRSDHAEVLHKGHGNMPTWVEGCPRKYWEAADIHERANGRLFKQIEFALPKELSPGQQTSLAASFCREIAQTKDGPLPFSFAVHKGHNKENQNPHCHCMISERMNDGHNRTPGLWFKRAAKSPTQGGAKKTTELRPREWLLYCRELWTERANRALQRAGHEARIDHRTLEAQGVCRAPAIHLGPRVTALEKQGVRTKRGDRNRYRNAAMEPTSVDMESIREEFYTMAKAANPNKVDKYYEEWVAPYVNLVEQAENKSSVYLQGKELFKRELTTDKELFRAIESKIIEVTRGRNWNVAKTQKFIRDCLSFVRTQFDRQKAYEKLYADVLKDLSRTKPRGLGR